MFSTSLWLALKTGLWRQTTQCSGQKPHLIGPSYVALRVRPCGVLVTSKPQDPWKPLGGCCQPAGAQGGPLSRPWVVLLMPGPQDADRS